MYNWVVRRIVERTSAPQPVYPTQVDAKVRTWMPAVALLAASFVTPAQAKLDVRGYDWAPQPAWIFTNLTPAATTAQRWPAIEAGTQRSYRTPARSQFDVRYTDWEWDAPYGASVDVSVRTWAPVFNHELGTFRTNDRPRLDVRSFEWAPPPAWIFTNLTPPPTTAQTWPAVLSNLPLSYRTAARAQFDVRYPDWDWDAPYGAAVDASVRTWAPVFSHALATFRTTARARLDVRTGPWSPDPAPWVFNAGTPTVTTAQVFPAIQQALSGFRTPDAPQLDVRRFEWLQAGWVTRIVDAVVAKWLPIWDAEFSYRTTDKPVLEVRSITGEPELAWLSSVIVFIPPPTVSDAAVTSIDASFVRSIDATQVRSIGPV